jgi:hypothetical protein
MLLKWECVVPPLPVLRRHAFELRLQGTELRTPGEAGRRRKRIPSHIHLEKDLPELHWYKASVSVVQAATRLGINREIRTLGSITSAGCGEVRLSAAAPAIPPYDLQLYV